MSSDRLHADAWLERLLVFVVAASLAGVGLAVAGRFQPALVWLLALAATVAYHLRAGATPRSGLALRGVHVLVVLLLALLFRTPPYQYVIGGQDPGVYTNMATHVLRTGGVAVRDAELERLAGTGAEIGYRRLNLVDPFVPGVYTRHEGGTRLWFQFYHLFPVWLALAASVFGVGAAGWGLTFLSLVSIVFFQRLAAQLSGSPRIGFAAGLLLAANPLHAFFSKFPVTEVPTLAFSTAAFCFLSMHALAAPGARPRRWLVLSALAMACLFLTRISGFMYLPLVLAVSVVALACDPDRGRARALSAWSLAVVLAYAASVAYGLAWSRPYTHRIHDDVFIPLFGLDWRHAVLAIIAATALAWAMAWRLRDAPVRATLDTLVGRLDRLMGPALLLVLPLAAYKAWQLGFTDHYVGNPVLGQFPGVVAAGWASVAHASLVVAALYLGPLAFVAVLAVAQARLSPAVRLLVFFVAGFFAYAAVLNWVVPYQPYYARYLLSELVPYALLLACVALAWVGPAWPRRLLVGALAVSGAGYLLMSSSQVGKQDNDGAFASIGALAGRIGDDDVVLLDGLRVPGFEPLELKTTLLYTFGRHVITVDAASLRDLGFMSAVDRAYDRVLVLSTRGTPPPGYTELAPAHLHSRGFERGSLPPHRRVTTMDRTLRVFRLDRLAFAPGFVFTQAIDAGRGTSTVSLPDLPAGRYRVVLRSEPAVGGDAVLKVVDDARGQVLGEARLQAEASAGGAVAWLDLEVREAGARDVVARMEMPAGSRRASGDLRVLRLR